MEDVNESDNLLDLQKMLEYDNIWIWTPSHP